MRATIEIALTFDVEFNKPSIIEATGSLYSGLDRMPGVLERLARRGVPGTWYVAHDVDEENQIARRFPGLVDSMARQGEIGCHFHFHQNRRVRTDEAFQRAGIGEATRYLRSLGHPVTSFRGGNGFLDATTLRVIEDLGFTTDSSVVPGLREVSPEGLVTDHTARRSCEPYFPLAGDPWTAGGEGPLEIPVATDTLFDLRTPVVSVLINRVIGIGNLVLRDPEGAARRIEAIRARSAGGAIVLALSAHPYDFLDGPLAAGLKLEHLDRFIGRMQEVPDTVFTTASGIRDRWTARPWPAARPARRSLIQVTTSDLRRMRNGVRRALRAGRWIA
ncbi:MAG TPA: polysaccharide deacetylase family protein [Candidatus Polarisedimenticolia bacterium]|jgi:peptidoglycan/xylan/chitin deacetylase (PgdA/CDA1 family)